jgi:hypothetical protein
MAAATVLSKATTKTVNRVETVIHFGWTDGEVTLLNQRQTSEMAAHLQPVVQMLRERPKSDTGGSEPKDFTSQLRELAELHSEGVLSDEEFALAKQRLLTGPN